ncbi:MAG: homoserine dehydrogenase [Thermoanaerobaculia bacterium]
MDSSRRPPLRVLLLGCGNVGRGLVRVLTVERDRYPGLEGLDIQIVGISTGTRGAVASDSGVDLVRALAELEGGGHFSNQNPDRVESDSLQLARELDYDVLVELTPLSIEHRGEPAISHIRSALERSRNVISANKGPFAYAYRDLMNLAVSRGVHLLHESTVMDGAPVLNLARHTLKGCRILALEGILNSTTNYVLSRMEEGLALQEAVELAQLQGYAEADPTLDLQGWDAAAKICVLANAFMGADLNPSEVDRQGIEEVTAEDLQEVGARGDRLKLVCRAWRQEGHVSAKVAVETVPAGHPLWSVSGTGAALRITTDLMAPIVVVQDNPGVQDTVYGVLGDLFTVTESFDLERKGSR